MNKLPSGWVASTLGDSLEVLMDHRGKTPGKLGGDFVDSGVPAISAMHIKDGRVDFSRRERFVTFEMFERWMPERLRQGDVLMTSEAPLGSLAFVPADDPLVLSQRLFAFRGRHGFLDNRYLRWFLESPLARHQLDERSSGSTVTGIRQAELRQLTVPIPPLDEQRRIVDLLEEHLSRLDAADAYLDAGRRRLDLLVQIALANCREGDLQLLGDVTTIQGGIQKQPKRAPNDNAFPFLRVANVTARGLDLKDVHRIELFDRELDRLRLQVGDLLVVEGNGSASQIGRAALWDGSIEDCVHQNHLIRVRPLDGLLPEYLEVVWNSPQYRATLSDVSSSSSGLHTLSVSKLKALAIPVPTVERQSELVAKVDEIRDARARLASAVGETSVRKNALRRSLFAAAFSGRLTREASELSIAEEMINA